MGCPIEDGSGDELIVAYGARRLAPQQQIELERHLNTCSRCRQMAEAQRTVWSALDSWSPSVVSPAFDATLFRRIATEDRAEWWRRLLPANWPWRPTVPVSAACAALIAAFLLKSPVLHLQPQSESPPKFQIEQVEHALDDMDMLKQLSGESSSDKAHSPEKI
jgi:anti-sigma factor RsiW